MSCETGERKRIRKGSKVRRKKGNAAPESSSEEAPLERSRGTEERKGENAFLTGYEEVMVCQGMPLCQANRKK